MIGVTSLLRSKPPKKAKEKRKLAKSPDSNRQSSNTATTPRRGPCRVRSRTRVSDPAGGCRTAILRAGVKGYGRSWCGTMDGVDHRFKQSQPIRWQADACANHDAAAPTRLPSLRLNAAWPITFTTITAGPRRLDFASKVSTSPAISPKRILGKIPAKGVGRFRLRSTKQCNGRGDKIRSSHQCRVNNVVHNKCEDGSGLVVLQSPLRCPDLPSTKTKCPTAAN